jgi:hypothetical protein
MIVYDFFSGTGSSTQAFKDAGHTVITFELDSFFEATENVDVLSLNAQDLIAKYGQPDFVWASPPCTSFSVASIWHHWANGGENPVPKTEAAKASQELVAHTLKLLQELNPSEGWLMENPRGMLRKLPVVKGFPRTTITYCQYGDSRMKPTDLWGGVKGWTPRPACKNGMPCHDAAPRGSKTGTQGLSGAKERSRIPLALSQDILQAIKSNKEGNK